VNVRLCALVLTLLPAAAAAQAAPRSLAVELGWSRDSAAALGARMPMALAASWWIGGELDATARLAWSSAPRTDGRATALVYEATAGVRYVVAPWRSVRPQLGVEAAVVQVASAGWGADLGLRLAGVAGVEAFIDQGFFLGLAVRASEVVLRGDGGVGAGVFVRGGAYF
jgi:hypothetical protein